MEGYITLNEWFSNHNINDKSDIASYLGLFYDMDRSMKYLHENGYYVTTFSDYSNIFINDRTVLYKNVEQLYPEDRDYIINNNIYALSSLALCIYNELPYKRPFNKESLRENYSFFSSSIPSDVSNYYNGIFMNDASVYLSDYIDAKREREGYQISSDNNNSQSSKGSGKALSYGTEYGKMYSGDDKANAFVMVFLFPALIFLLSILIPLILILRG